MNQPSFLDKLLDGAEVSWVPLGEVAETLVPPTKLKKEAYQDHGRMPIIDQGKEFISGYTDKEVECFPSGKYILFGDHSENIKYVDFSFVQGADGLKVLKSHLENTKYIYYAFLAHYRKNPGYNRHWSDAKKTSIPIPCPEDPEKSLAIQARIVKILDALSSHIEALGQEAEARGKQYRYYRDRLLSFEAGEAEWKTLGEVATLKRGRVMSKEYLINNAGEFPVFSSQTAKNGVIGKIDTFDFDGEYITWTTDGANAGTVFYRTGKFSITNVCGSIKLKEESKLRCKFLFYWLSIKAKRHVYAGMGNPKLMSNQVEKIPIPIPPLAEQARIVSVLDRFDALAHSLEKGLPYEIQLRQKQYEYYRDWLLSFSRP